MSVKIKTGDFLTYMAQLVARPKILHGRLVFYIGKRQSGEIFVKTIDLRDLIDTMMGLFFYVSILIDLRVKKLTGPRNFLLGKKNAMREKKSTHFATLRAYRCNSFQ